MIKKFKITNEKFKILGRTKFVDDVFYMNYSCSGIEFEFTGSKLTATICSNYYNYEDSFRACIAVFINDKEMPYKRFSLLGHEKEYTLYESETVQNVKIKIIKMSECAFAKVGIKEIAIHDFKGIKKAPMKDKRIEFIGDSITCGYGNEGIVDIDTFDTSQENPYEAYAAKTARALNADYNLVAWSGIGIISCYTEEEYPNTDILMKDLYKYTDMDMDKILGKKEKDYEVYDNSTFNPDLVVINLGTNDFSYTKDIDSRIYYFKEQYFKFLKQIRKANPDSTILCIYGIMGDDLYSYIEETVETFKKEFSDEKVYCMHLDVHSENDGRGTDFHPTLISHQKLATKLTSKIKEIMDWE